MSNVDWRGYYEASYPASLLGTATPKAALFDPGDNTVADVKAYVEANPDQVETVLAAEQDGKNRATLVTWLEEQSEPQPEEQPG